ncbi:MAG: glycosyltransferase family 39 protein, partial [Scytonema sp. PMC 1069.18]|nr:glycosyltransferase family 39 protein [Scytonema sp. PMC 1069.18]
MYWHDETYTLLRASGYTVEEVIPKIFDGQVIELEKLKKYQSFNPDKNFVDTINSLATEDQHHPPMYYLMTRWWIEYFGDSVMAIRTLPVLISLFTIPCIYWLCLELFNINLTGWIAMALMAVSPFHVYYAQEAREYSLWTVMILLMSASLLQALRLKTRLTWGIYAATTTLTLYSAGFSIFILISHGIYVAVIEGFRWSKEFVAYLLASFTGLLAFSPWIVIFCINFAKVRQSTGWMDMTLTPLALAKTWISNIGFVFFKALPIPGSLNLVLALAVTALVGYSFYILFKETPIRVWLFVLTLALPLTLTLLLADLILGGIRSTNSRYLIPFYLGCQLVVSYFLAYQIISTKLSFWKQKQWASITVIFITVGIISCGLQSFKQSVSDNQQVADIINKASRPLVISNEVSSKGGGTFGDIMTLSHLLESKVKFQLVIDPAIPDISRKFSDVFLYKISEILNQSLEKKYKMQPMYK